MRMFRTTAFTVLIAGFFALPQSTHAAVTTTYDGCFDFESGLATATVHMLDMICTITLENDATARTWRGTIANLDPHYYEVLRDGQRMDTTNTVSRIAASVELQANESTTITVQPWEDLDTLEQVTIFAGGDPQNPDPNEVPNPIFINFMEYASTINELLLVIAGDVIRGDSSDATAQAFEYEQTVQLIEETPLTTVATVGDHDARQDREEYFEAYLGQIPRVVSYNSNVELFLINSAENPGDVGEVTNTTMTWLENALQESEAEYKVVVLHHPFDVPNGANSSGLGSTDKLQLAQLLVEHNVQVAFVGDAHWYEVSTINATTEGFEGLTGGFLQMVMGGLGGRILQYQEVHPDTADHFLMMVTFGDEEDDDGITYTRLAQDDLDVSKEEHSRNDGTETAIDVTVHNTGSVDIPQMRVKFTGVKGRNSTYYAFTSEGEVLQTKTTQFGNTTRGYVQLYDVAAGTSLDVRMEAVKTPYVGVTNTYKRDGTITFEELPVSADDVTQVKVREAERAGSIHITGWDPTRNIRTWTERAGAKGAKTKYTITDLDPYRMVTVKVNGNVKMRRMANGSGTITFSQRGKKRRNIVVLADSRLTPTKFGALPAADGAAQMRVYKNNSRVANSFSAMSSTSEHGFTSTWVDADNDGDLELAVAPTAGTAGRVFLYEKNGTKLASKYPFGKGFTQGVEMTGANLDGSGKEMLVVAPTSGDGAVRVFTYRNRTGQLKQLKRFRPFGKNYTGGVNVVAADVNGDGDDEFVVSSRANTKVVKVYNWNAQKNKVKLIDSVRASRDTNGVSLAAGDIDFDGRDEIVVGSLLASGTSIAVIEYKASSRQLKVVAEKDVYGSNAGGMQVAIANVNGSERSEIFVAPTGGVGASDTVKGYKYTRKKKLEEIASFQPLGEGFIEGFMLAFADLNKNGKMELAIGARNGDGKMHVYRKTKNAMKRIHGASPYGESFDSGLNLTQ